MFPKLTEISESGISRFAPGSRIELEFSTIREASSGYILSMAASVGSIAAATTLKITMPGTNTGFLLSEGIRIFHTKKAITMAMKREPETANTLAVAKFSLGVSITKIGELIDYSFVDAADESAMVQL